MFLRPTFSHSSFWLRSHSKAGWVAAGMKVVGELQYGRITVLMDETDPAYRLSDNETEFLL